MMVKHPGKTPAQRRVLDAIGCGNFSPIMGDATRDKMLRDGLIVELTPRRDIAFGSVYMTIRQFEMSIPVHIAWCDWCSANCDDAALSETPEGER